MSATKTCPTCGAENDVIFTNCLYCKTSLPKVDSNSISNEDLIMNAGEWVGKARQYDFVDTSRSGKQVIIKHVMNAEIVGYAEKYLSLIQVRAISNPNIIAIHESLRKQLEENKLFASKNDPTSKLMEQYWRNFPLMAVVISILFIGCLIMGYLSNH